MTPSTTPLTYLAVGELEVSETLVHLMEGRLPSYMPSIEALR
jgi:hypothetical protein